MKRLSQKYKIAILFIFLKKNLNDKNATYLQNQILGKPFQRRFFAKNEENYDKIHENRKFWISMQNEKNTH